MRMRFCISIEAMFDMNRHVSRQRLVENLAVVLWQDAARVSLGDRRRIRVGRAGRALRWRRFHGPASHRGRWRDAISASPLAPKAHAMAVGQGQERDLLSCHGGLSHVDTFDYKPNLYPPRRQDDRRQDVCAGVRKRRTHRRTRSGRFGSMVRAASGFPICFRIWQPASTISRSSTRCMPNRRFMAQPC